MDDSVALVIELLYALSREQRIEVLRQFQDELREPEHLNGGGMLTGSMVLLGAAPASGPGR